MFQVFSIAHIEHIIASNQSFSNVATALPIQPLFSVVELEIHVSIESDEGSLVLHAPLEFDNHRLIDEVDQEGFWVDWNRLSVLLSLLLRLCSSRHGLAAIWLN